MQAQITSEGHIYWTVKVHVTALTSNPCSCGNAVCFGNANSCDYLSISTGL